MQYYHEQTRRRIRPILSSDMCASVCMAGAYLHFIFRWAFLNLIADETRRYDTKNCSLRRKMRLFRVGFYCNLAVGYVKKNRLRTDKLPYVKFIGWSNIQRLVSDTIWRGEIKNNKQDIPKKNLSKLMSESYE